MVIYFRKNKVIIVKILWEKKGDVGGCMNII